MNERDAAIKNMLLILDLAQAIVPVDDNLHQFLIKTVNSAKELSDHEIDRIIAPNYYIEKEV